MPTVFKSGIWPAALFVALLTAGCARAPGALPAAAPALQAPPAPLYHTVERGQTLYRIAKLYRVDVRQLMHLNGIADARALETGRRLRIPKGAVARVPLVTPPAQAPSPEVILRLIGPTCLSSKWRTITVHHSATRKGSAAHFHRDHLRRRMGGLFYHFVIGNGSYTGDGAIEVGWRWQRQVKANRPADIQICLVGDFSRDSMSEAQFGSLVGLVSALQAQYHIPDSAVRKHEDIKGKRTECPGKHFPFDRLLQELAAR